MNSWNHSSCKNIAYRPSPPEAQLADIVTAAIDAKKTPAIFFCAPLWSHRADCHRRVLNLTFNSLHPKNAGQLPCQRGRQPDRIVIDQDESSIWQKLTRFRVCRRLTIRSALNAISQCCFCPRNCNIQVTAGECSDANCVTALWRNGLDRRERIFALTNPEAFWKRIGAANVFTLRILSRF